MCSFKMHPYTFSNILALCTIGMLSFYGKQVESNHRVGGLMVDVNLRLAAGYLRYLCANFEECGTNPWTSEGRICCLKCSCDPSCIITHSCCPESGYHPIGEIYYTSGREGMVCRNGIRVGTSLGVFIHPEYEFLQGCPPDTPNDVKDKCDQAFAVNDSSLIRSLPLYDTVRGINYANMYCALCNNAADGDLAPWKPSIRCQETIDSSTLTIYELEEKIFANDCHLTFDPPDLDISHTICFNDVITTCNVTGNWVTYDFTADLFCDVLDMIYVSNHDGPRTYKNIVCALCNGVELGVLDMTDCPFNNRNNFTVSFTSVLQFSVRDLSQYADNGREPTVNDKGCLGNFAFDPLMGRCMPVYCSSPHILDTAVFQCKTLFGKTSNAVASHTFAMMFKKAAIFSNAYNSALEIVEKVKTTSNTVCSTSVFYQTTLKAGGNLEDFVLDATAQEITGLFVTTRYYILNTNPDDERLSTSHATEIIFNNSSLYNYTGPGTFDPGMLRYIANSSSRVTDSGHDIFELILTDHSHYLFRNIYDNTVIIGEHNDKIDLQSTCLKRPTKIPFNLVF